MAVRQAIANGKLKGNEKFPVKATVTLGGISFTHEIKGEIELDDPSDDKIAKEVVRW